MVRDAGVDRGGAGDWWCQRRSDIEHTAGVTEAARVEADLAVDARGPVAHERRLLHCSRDRYRARRYPIIPADDRASAG
jgi:hypothetical protein